MATRSTPSWPQLRAWLPYLGVGALVLLLTARPTLMIPVATAYAALCERYPVLAFITNHTAPLAVLLALAGVALVAGGWTAGVALLATLGFTRRLHRRAVP